MGRLLFTATVLVIGLLVGVIGTVGYQVSSAPARGELQARAAAARLVAPARQSSEGTISDVYDRVSPAVVNITFTAIARDVFGRPATQEGTGSGFVIDDRGHVVTNNHVVGGATRLDITLADGSGYIGELVGADPANDLAVVRIAAPPEVLRGLTVLPLGDSDQLRVGQTVIAIGNPFGLERSASVGIVSSLGRTRPGETERLITNMIQTDAAINPGNSGGPMLNLDGEVVGINEQIEAPTRGNVGIGFAVPVNTLKRYLSDLLAGREPQHAWMAVSGTRLTATLAEQLNLPVTQGVIVASVVPGGPAARAGFRGIVRNNVATADIIVDIDGRPMRSVEDVATYVDQFEPGDRVRVRYLRGGQFQTVEVTLGVWQRTGLPVR